MPKPQHYRLLLQSTVVSLLKDARRCGAGGTMLWRRALRGLTGLRRRLAASKSHEGKTVGERRIHGAAVVESGVTAQRHAAPGSTSVAHQGALHRRRHIVIRLPGSDKKRLPQLQ